MFKFAIRFKSRCVIINLKENEKGKTLSNTTFGVPSSNKREKSILFYFVFSFPHAFFFCLFTAIEHVTLSSSCFSSNAHNSPPVCFVKISLVFPSDWLQTMGNRATDWTFTWIWYTSTELNICGEYRLQPFMNTMKLRLFSKRFSAVYHTHFLVQEQ